MACLHTQAMTCEIEKDWIKRLEQTERERVGERERGSGRYRDREGRQIEGEGERLGGEEIK